MPELCHIHDRQFIQFTFHCRVLVLARIRIVWVNSLPNTGKVVSLIRIKVHRTLDKSLHICYTFLNPRCEITLQLSQTRLLEQPLFRLRSQQIWHQLRLQQARYNIRSPHSFCPSHHICSKTYRSPALFHRMEPYNTPAVIVHPRLNIVYTGNSTIMLVRATRPPNVCIADGKGSTAIIHPRPHEIKAKEYLHPLVEGGDGQEITGLPMIMGTHQVSIPKFAE